MLKSIEVEFKCKKYLINKWVVLVNRFTCEQITRLIESGMPNVYKIKKPNIQQNMLTLIMTILECYKGGYNALRRTVVRHCLNLITDDVFDKAKLSAINDLNWRLGLICNWEVNVRRATRCRFVYWQRSLCPVFFKEIITDKTRLNQMNYYLAALSDPIDMLQNIKHLPSAQIAIENYKKDIYEAFTQHVIRPICAKTEEELR
jgi:hypothetical protein